ncbi:MAG: tRNA (adenosine(37)-N6)-dimethylallyltransferase MiaA [Rhodothermales bacterium]|nr:tRNA (adenosine(37)-N6)-dimethylallyltransferase MiaA [Rhodothermales bacterium]
MPGRTKLIRPLSSTDVDPFPLTPIPIIAGPTGVGKTSVSLELASILDAEIVNADSRQVYRGMTIGTAKPSDAELRKVPHHMIDILEIDEVFSAGKFMSLAQSCIQDIVDRDKIPIVVGGSTLYISSLTHGLADIPKIPNHYRTDIEDAGTRLGFDQLYQELAAVDPESAKSMDPTKTQRIVRALEVYRATGRTLSSFHSTPLKLPYDFSLFVLNRPRPELYDRINSRVAQMLDGGLVDEVAGLRDGGKYDDLYPLRSPGYREAIQFLRGDITESEMTRLIARDSRRYAKRQLTWFRRYPDKYWIDAASTSATTIAESLRDHLI